jgi:hypothetical protein
MKSTPHPFPGLRTLYRVESMIQRSVTVMILGLMLAGGIWWVVRPFPNAPTPAYPSMTVQYAPWISAAGVTLAALAGLVVLGRYLLVKKIFSHGDVIKGTAVEVDRHDTNMHSDTRTGSMRTTPTYVHYVTLNYDVHGDDYTVRQKLPHTPSTYGIKKGGEVALLVLEAMPRKPLIREVYLGSAGGKSSFLFW